jgi:hypothetical protein
VPLEGCGNGGVHGRGRLDRPDQVDHRQVRQAGIAQVDTLCPQHQWCWGDRPGQQLADQPGLSAPGLRRDEDRTGVAVRRVRHGFPQDGELTLAADERHVALGSDHDRIIPPAHRQRGAFACGHYDRRP